MNKAAVFTRRDVLRSVPASWLLSCSSCVGKPCPILRIGMLRPIESALFPTETVAVVRALTTDHLCIMDRGAIVPGLATRWSADATYTRWIFHIRPDVILHDDRTLTAHDIARVINCMTIGAADPELLDFLLPDGASARDDHMLLVRAKRGHPMFPCLLSSANPSSVIAPDFDHPQIHRRLNGSGPMKVDWIDLDHGFLLSRHRGSWRHRDDLPDRLHFIFFPDFASQVRAHANAEIDVIGHVS